ncbi:MAG TPA: PA14 domain-containing protein [Kiritimatiellia bacterium]|nr:PA14 domain-containing protein [Kiritimatiellia bacterium]HNS79909.1 PA14 domain-containing protein [Kiritimatiellia bacterium]HQQ03587.1 PA14 domain-containing protein [Kiritimatiellia bacterium]
MKIQQYLQREKQIHKAWAKLNKAADALESTRALVLLAGALSDLRGDMPSGGIAEMAGQAGLTAAEQEQIEGLLTGEKDGADTGMHNIGALIALLWRIIREERLHLMMNAPRGALFLRRMLQVALLAAGVFAAALLIRAGCYAVRLAAYNGCRVTYYRGTDFNQKIGVSVEPALRAGYKRNRPFWYAPASKWSARWEADLKVPDDDVYSFFTQSDDGLRLYIDDDLLVDSWKDQEWRTSGQHAEIRLSSGFHRIRVEHYFRSGSAAIVVKWAGGSVPKNTVLEYPYLQKPGGRLHD